MRKLLLAAFLGALSAPFVALPPSTAEAQDFDPSGRKKKKPGGGKKPGGTGKTPTVLWLAELAHRRGRRVGVLARGYGRASGQRE